MHVWGPGFCGQGKLCYWVPWESGNQRDISLQVSHPPTPEDCRNDGLKFTSSLSVKEASLLVLEHWPEM